MNDVDVLCPSADGQLRFLEECGRVFPPTVLSEFYVVKHILCLSQIFQHYAVLAEPTYKIEAL